MLQYVKPGAGLSLASSRSATRTHAKRLRSHSLLPYKLLHVNPRCANSVVDAQDTCTAQLFQYYAVARRTVVPPLLQPPEKSGSSYIKPPLAPPRAHSTPAPSRPFFRSRLAVR